MLKQAMFESMAYFFGLRPPYTQILDPPLGATDKELFAECSVRPALDKGFAVC